MAEEENIPEEDLIDNSQQPAENVNEIISQKQPIEVKEQPIRDMEAHHSSYVHHQKKWKDYLFEFLMLFLAVTLGFFVENQREHYVERQRAKELVASMGTDLKKDTSLINWLQNFRDNIRKPRLDSFYTLLNTPSENIDKGTYYGLMYRVAEFYTFSQSTGTINQLKNAGYLRYFSDPELLNYIADYDFLVQDFKSDENMEFHLHYDKLMAFIKQNADNDEAHQFYIEGIIAEGTGIKPLKPDVLNLMKALLIEVMWYNHPQMKKTK